MKEWLPYLNSLPSGLTITSLDHVKKIAHVLGVMKFPGKIVTIAGTNGKGSCVAFLEAILVAAGYKVGAYISPHLLRYNERIRINGDAIDDDLLRSACAAVKIAQSGMVLSYFEFGTLVALKIFKQMELDVLLLEVGLGGRLDAVNILDADIAIISTIALDHMLQLGNTREDIGREKSGIMRKFKPIICGDPKPPRSVYASANKTKAILYCVQQDFTYTIEQNSWKWDYGSWHLENLPLPHLPLPDAATALMAIALLSTDVPVDYHAIVTGLSKAFLFGRWQRLREKPEVIADVAHNAEATAFLADNLMRHPAAGKTLAVMSMFKDKDIVAALRPMIGIVDRWYIAALALPRAASVEQLRHHLSFCNVQKINSYENVVAAFGNALAEAQENDRIIVFGSFYTVAEVLRATSITQ